MTLTGLAVRNLGRNNFRAILTAIGVAIAIVAFLLLRTVTWSWASGAEYAAKDRVVTRHKVTFVMSCRSGTCRTRPTRRTSRP